MTATDRIHQLLDSLDERVLNGLYGRGMLLTQEWSRAELDALLTLVEVFDTCDRAGIQVPLFPNELFYALFFDNSTRTKSSWAGAAARLGAMPFVADAATTQVAHGETAEETGAMLGMNAHALGIRHDLILGEGNKFMREAQKGINDYLKAKGEDRVVPLVNLQCDIDHPTQTLADLAWLRERFPEGLAGKTMAVSWAYSPSYAKPLSVPQGLIMLMTRFGMNVRLAHPKGYDLMPDCVATAQKNAREHGGSFTQVASMDEAFAGADIVYPKSWGPYDLMLERVEANRKRDAAAMKDIEGRALARNAQYKDWICDERRMGLTRGGKSAAGGAGGAAGASGGTDRALYMHCLPADIGAEVSPGVMEGARVDVAREANKKVFVIAGIVAAGKTSSLGKALSGVISGARAPRK
jgi:knotted carbamoyltransferase YgeW